MKPDSESILTPAERESGIIGDDRYLVEMTERLQKLRLLMGEQEARKGRPKRWVNRVGFAGSY